MTPSLDGRLDLKGAGTLTAAEVLARLGSRPTGLSSEEAAKRLRELGANSLGVHHVSAGSVLLRQLRNPLLILLMAAAVVSDLTGGGANAIIIGVIVALSVLLGFVNEYRAEVAMDALRDRIHHEAEVLRDGRSCRIPVGDLVPGDVVTLRIGDLVPADLRLMSIQDLECDEAVLTGESLPVAKSAAPCTGDDALDGPACALMGTIVHRGSGVAVVVETGPRTSFGKIAAGLSEQQGRTAFELGLSRFSRLLFVVAAILTVFIFVVNVALSRPIIDALLFSLAIAVGIAPEMMPAIVTVSLATGSKALVAKKVLVKRLVAIEDLGNIEILFTDKTGTLTEGAIAFEAALDATGHTSDRALLLGLVCNEASVDADGPLSGNPLDAALWAAPGAQPGGALRAEAQAYARQGILPFDHERQLASVLVRDPAGNTVVVTKGAPEVVLARCATASSAAQEELETLFSQGARVIAVATRAVDETFTLEPQGEIGLELIGFLTFADTPKPDAGESIAKLEALGIEVKIITGDNGLVAAKVCADIGLECAGVLTGADVVALGDDELAAAILTTTVFARIGPDEKSRIVKVARRTGKDVAFLGDGVNDAVALHHADVGISVDSGTDVAKDAADVVLLDKDLGVLAEGVMEGRRIFNNTMKYVLMATSSNFGNMFSAAGASLFLSFLPMLPSQILLNNLLYDTGQLAIPTDNVDPEALARPAAWDMGFIRRFMGVFGPLSSIFDFLTFWVMLSVLHAGHAEFRTGWFVESIATQTLVVYVIRTRRVPFFRSRPSTPMLLVPTSMAVLGAVLPYTGLAHILGFTPLPATFFLILFGMVVTYLLLVEYAKSLFFRAPHATTPGPVSTHEERVERQIRRRRARFIRHVPRVPGDAHDLGRDPATVAGQRRPVTT